MAQSSILPVIIKGQYQGGDAFGQLVADAKRSGSQAKQAFEQDFAEIGRITSQALSRPRNAAGSLDLDAGNLREAAADAQAYATALREVTNAAIAEAAAVGDTSAETGRFIKASQAATKQAEIEARELSQTASIHERLQQQLNETKSATDRMVASQARGTTAQQSVINSSRASRTAFVQLGQQMQDVTIQAQLGTNAFTIFAQQVPQAAFALSGLENSANKTQARIGRFATFLAGPWGAAIFAATAVLGPLIYSLIDTGDEAKDAEKKVYDFSDGLNVLELSARQSANAMKQLADEMRGAIIVQGDFLRQKAAIANQSVGEIQGRLTANSAELASLQEQASGPLSLLPFNQPNYRRIGQLRSSIAADTAALQGAREAQTASEIAVAQTRVTESLDASTAAIGRYNRAIGNLNKRYELSKKDPISAGSQFIDQKGYEAEFERLTKLKNAEVEAARAADKKDRKGPDPAKAIERAARETYRLSEFAADAENKIGRIRQSFTDTPPAIARMNDGMAALSDMASDIDEKVRRGLDPKIAADLKAQIEALRPVIADSINQPFRDMVEASEKNAAIQDLLIAGKEVEAEVLSRVLDLNEKSSSVTDAQIQSVYQIVAQERLRSRELEKQNDLRQREADLVNSTRDNIRGALQDLARGGGAGAIGRAFKRQFDLVLTNQIDKMFEGLFGNFFREERDKALGFDLVKDASKEQVESIRGTITALDDFEASLRSAASGVAHAANDNERGIVGPDGEITVVRSPNRGSYDLEGEFDKEFGAGPASRHSFLASISETLAGAVGGKEFGKSVGEAVANAQSSNGAAYGALAGGFAFGGRGSPFLSAVGGAVGEKVLGPAIGKEFASIAKSLGDLGGPIGSIIGGLAGGLLGSVLSSTPRASSTIGVGADGSLQVVGTRGNSASRRKASEGSAGEAIDTLDRIAEALGASIDASRGSVSIGVRKGNYRVDPTGRGTTKTSRGAIDFGEDSAAAIRAATMDLIQDGVLQGLRDSTQRLLQQADDLDSAIQKATDFEGVFQRLKAIKDPVGAAIDGVDKEFTRLIKIFEEAGASADEWAQLEELYGHERADAIKDATEAATSSLRDFISGLETGDNGLSLRSRLSNAKAIYDPLAAAVRAGEKVDYGDFTDAAQTMLGISRELFGSQQEYFATFNEVLSLSKQALAGQENVTSIAEGRDTPFSNRTNADTVPVVSAVTDLSQLLLTQSTGTNEWLEKIYQALAANNNSGTPKQTGTYF